MKPKDQHGRPWAHRDTTPSLDALKIKITLRDQGLIENEASYSVCANSGKPLFGYVSHINQAPAKRFIALDWD